MKSKFILLHPQDNILVCCQQAVAGEIIDFDKEKIVLMQNIDLAHKVSREALSKGDKIIKYGVSIGSALQDIGPGEHVHMHNMKSDYIPPHTRERLQEVGDSK
jgi:altronate dehydratase small subunit